MDHLYPENDYNSAVPILGLLIFAIIFSWPFICSIFNFTQEIVGFALDVIEAFFDGYYSGE